MSVGLMLPCRARVDATYYGIIVDDHFKVSDSAEG
jgi:hypothetical protein